MTQDQGRLLHFLDHIGDSKVFPDPVTPNKVWKGTPLFMPSDRAAIASGWSPVGLNGEDNSKFILYL